MTMFFRRTVAVSLATASLIALASARAQAGTVPTLTESQVLTWDFTTPLTPGAAFGIRLAVGEASSGTALALIGAPGAGAAQLFELGPEDAQWSSRPPIPPSVSQGLPVAFDDFPLYAALEVGGTHSIRRADTGQVLVSGIDGGPVLALVKSGTTLAFGQPDFFGGSGRVRIYERNAAGTGVHAKTFVGGQTDACFGFSVALDGDLLAIGSPFLDRTTAPSHLLNVGGVYIYEVLTFPFLEFELQALLRPPEATSGDSFGYGLALTVPGEPVLVAGSPGEDSGTFNGGAVYRYVRTSSPHASSWHLLTRMARSVPGEIESLGYSVAFWEGGVLAGAPFPQPDSIGSVLFFDLRLFADGFESGDFSAWDAVVP